MWWFNNKTDLEKSYNNFKEKVESNDWAALNVEVPLYITEKAAKKEFKSLMKGGYLVDWEGFDLFQRFWFQPESLDSIINSIDNYLDPETSRCSTYSIVINEKAIISNKAFDEPDAHRIFDSRTIMPLLDSKIFDMLATISIVKDEHLAQCPECGRLPDYSKTGHVDHVCISCATSLLRLDGEEAPTDPIVQAQYILNYCEEEEFTVQQLVVPSVVSYKLIRKIQELQLKLDAEIEKPLDDDW